MTTYTHEEIEASLQHLTEHQGEPTNKCWFWRNAPTFVRQLLDECMAKDELYNVTNNGLKGAMKELDVLLAENNLLKLALADAITVFGITDSTQFYKAYDKIIAKAIAHGS